MSTLQQQNRLIAIDTPLGENVLALTSFSGHEELSRLFSYQLEMVSEEDSIKAADIVGKNVTISIRLADDSFRYFNGFVSQFSTDYGEGDVPVYRAEVVPWLWFLTQTSDCRIFQNQTIPEIIEQIFNDLGFSDFETSEIKGNHPTWDYCVQYRETDFNFVSRLMEQEGIFYYFRHDDGKHTLVLADQKGAYKDLPEKEVECPPTSATQVFEDHITNWAHRYRFVPGKWAQTDYNFETPSTSLMAQTKSVVKLPGIDKYEIYDYPGEYENKGDGEADVKIHMEEEEAAYDIVNGSSTCRTFTPGGKFTLTRHSSPAEEGKSYVITSIHHSATEPGTYTTNGRAGGREYSNSFTCIPESVVFRPARTTPKPLVSGVQTAAVVGPSGEEIYCDEYGRVKVQFHWDREGAKDDNSSCWIRVSHNMAGKQWGFVSIPRIGQEVVVDFLEGDPDRPLIVGSVYNAEQMPPYALPANQTQSGIKTRSSKGGSSSNFNEIRFEDKKGSEELYFHAEKDQNIIVENDRSEYVGNDRSLIVDRDKAEQVKRNKSIEVTDNHTEQIGKNMALSVGSNLTETVGTNHSETVGAMMQLTVGAAMTVSVGGLKSLTVGGRLSETVGLSRAEIVGGSKSSKVGKDVSETIAGNQTTKILKDLSETVEGKHTEGVTKEYQLNAKKVTIVAKDEISLKTGKAELVMKKNGDIIIKGKKITVKGTSDVVVKGSKIAQN
jgi:type VI secretion system secreted protein VgrG